MPKKKSNFNLEQKKAISHDLGPLLIVAGAGTGKTTVVTERIGYLLEKKNLTPDQILALTFTDKAANEMVERLDRRLPYGYTDLWVQTFHGFAQKILQLHGLDVGLPGDFKVLSETQSWLLVRKNLDKFNLDYYRPLGNPSKFISALIKHFSRCKDELVKPSDYLALAEKMRLDNDTTDTNINLEVARLTELAESYHVYQQLLLDHGYLDFGDLINYCLELFKQRPKILAKYQEQFQYVLVDEFQDTNYAQYELIKLLSEPKNNITVVGDDDQAIYKFRGASVSNILQFKKDFPDAHEIVLTKNYRSCQEILNVSYKFIQANNPNRLEVSLAGKVSKKLKSQLKTKGVIEHLAAATADQEVGLVVNKILELKDSTDCSWNDFAILARSNDQTKAFIEGLEVANIPYQYLASRGLYAKPLVLDVVAFLKILVNPHQSDAFIRYLAYPCFNLPWETIINLSHQANRKSLSLYEAARQSRALISLEPSVGLNLDKALSVLDKYLVLAKDKKVSFLVYNFWQDSGYLKHLENLPESEKIVNFNYFGQFYKRLKTFEELNSDQRVVNFLTELDLELVSGDQGSLEADLSEGPELVKVMTIHGSKGLEFKHVFIVNMVDRRFPTIERRDQIELPDSLIKEMVPEGDVHLQEERRLFYVGLTRAKLGVYLTSAQDYGGARDKKISIFLKDLGFVEKEMKNLPMVFELPKKQTNQLIAKSNWQQFIPKRFSFTQLKDFQHCPRVYYYRYIIKLPQLGNQYFSFGSTIHLTLQRFFEEAKRQGMSSQATLFGQTEPKTIREMVSLETLEKIYQDSWIDDWYQDKLQKEQYREKGKKIIRDFYNSDYLTKAKVLYLEKPFSLSLGDFSLTGKIDRIDSLGEGFKIVDYKTGNPKEKLEAEDKEQLLIYQLAVQEIFRGTVEELAYYYLENDTQVAFKGLDKDLDKLKKSLTSTVNEIRHFDFPDFLATHEKCIYCKDIL